MPGTKLSRPGPDGQPAAEPMRQKKAARARAPKTATQPSVSALDVAMLRERLRKGFGACNTARPGSLSAGRQPGAPLPPAGAPPSIPATEILSWFKNGFEIGLKRRNKPPMPAKLQAEELSRMLRAYQALRPDPVHATIREFAAAMQNVAPALEQARKGLTEALEPLRQAVENCKSYADASTTLRLPDSTARALMQEPEAVILAIDVLLKRYPARGRGKKIEQGNPVWLPVVFDWMQAVLLVLEEAASYHVEIDPSTPRTGAVAPHVVSQMIKRVFGSIVEPATIARRYRSILAQVESRSPGTIGRELRARREAAEKRRNLKASRQTPTK